MRISDWSSDVCSSDLKITPAQLEAAITPRTKWVLLNSPSNPSGAAYSADELAGLGEVLKKPNHVLVMPDDMYEHIWYPDTTFATVAQLCPDLVERPLTIQRSSNAHSMTPFPTGQPCGPPWVIQSLKTEDRRVR